MSFWVLLSSVPILVWTILLFGRNGFWRALPRLEHGSAALGQWPKVTAIIPARDEADVIETAVRSLLAQDYPGRLDIVVVDDRSTDQTGAIVRALIPEVGPMRRLSVLENVERPAGWSGKLWAIQTGLDHLEAGSDDAALLLLTDADIVHDPANLTALAEKMVNDDRDLVSIMVRLRNQSFWERLLIPPFVFFFQMLYPFPVVNEPDHKAAAAAGGCLLVRRDALYDAGGILAISDALIDDVALGRLIKARSNGRRRIWLGHGTRTTSVRANDGLSPIWAMVARTADTQLGHSFANLAATVLGMALICLLPPLLALTWPLHEQAVFGLLGLAAWAMMSIAFWPTLKLYQQSAFWAPVLPLAALLFTGMTIDSARLHRQGQGGRWKGRTHSG